MIKFSGKTQHPNVAVLVARIQPDVGEIKEVTTFVSKKNGSIWYGLHTLDQLWELLKKHKGERECVRIVAGNTAYGIQPLQQLIREQTIMLFIGRIPDLTELTHDDDQIIARCAVPIQQLWDLTRSLSEAHEKADKRSTYPPSVAYKHWRRLATTEIRNVASIAGNLYIAKLRGFPSDLCMVLAALGATIIITDHNSSRQEYGVMEFLHEDDILNETNIIYEVKIPIKERKDVFIDTYKVSQRPQNSHPLVNAGFSMKVEERGYQEVRIFYGNVGEAPQEMTVTEKWMEKNCTPANLAGKLPELFIILEKELRGIVTKKTITSKDYLVDTACNIFFKYLAKMARVFKFPGWDDIKHVSV